MDVDNSIIEQIEMRMIRPSQFPVRHMDQTDISDLKVSIKEHGLLQPIVIRPVERGFEIVAGHRRFAACRLLHWRFITCKIRDLTDRQAYEIQLTENIQRRSMDPIEEAEAYQKYVSEYGWGGIAVLGRKIGKSQEYISHRIQLLKLPEQIIDNISDKKLSPSQALELTSVDNSIRTRLVNDIIDNNLTVKQIRVIKKQSKSETRKPKTTKSFHIIKKSQLSLRIALSQIDSLIDDAHTTATKDRSELIKFLMSLRLQIHAMIDDTIKFKKQHS